MTELRFTRMFLKMSCCDRVNSRFLHATQYGMYLSPLSIILSHPTPGGDDGADGTALQPQSHEGSPHHLTLNPRRTSDRWVVFSLRTSRVTPSVRTSHGWVVPSVRNCASSASVTLNPDADFTHTSPH